MTQSIPLSSIGGSSSPSAKFANIGDRAVGRIVDIDNERVQTDISGNVVTFDDGRPRPMLVIELEQADGSKVSLYAKGGAYEVAEGEGTSMTTAIVEAATAAGAPTIDAGAELAVVFTGYGKAKAGLSRPKLFRAAYKPPAQSVNVAGLFSQGGPS
jgi:hypothetical protein